MHTHPQLVVTLALAAGLATATLLAQQTSAPPAVDPIARLVSGLELERYKTEYIDGTTPSRLHLYEH